MLFTMDFMILYLRWVRKVKMVKELQKYVDCYFELREDCMKLAMKMGRKYEKQFDKISEMGRLRRERARMKKWDPWA